MTLNVLDANMNEDSKWISCKERLPEEGIHVIAKNPHIEAESWIEGIDDFGKPMSTNSHQIGK